MMSCRPLSMNSGQLTFGGIQITKPYPRGAYPAVFIFRPDILGDVVLVRDEAELKRAICAKCFDQIRAGAYTNEVEKLVQKRLENLTDAEDITETMVAWMMERCSDSIHRSEEWTVAHAAHPSSDGESAIVRVKRLRRQIDACIQEAKSIPVEADSGEARENNRTSIIKLKEAAMWQGMHLKALGEPTPYPNSRDTSNKKVDPTADGMKL